MLRFSWISLGKQYEVKINVPSRYFLIIGFNSSLIKNRNAGEKNVDTMYSGMKFLSYIKVAQATVLTNQKSRLATTNQSQSQNQSQGEE